MKIRIPKRGRTSGSATVEFAIIAPVLIMAVLSTADVGFAIHQSFEIDQALRNGAEMALSDPGEANVEAVLSAVDTTGGGQIMTKWIVDRYHACPTSPGVKSKEPMNCADDRPTAIFYDISGVRAYPGILLPARDLTRSASVQVR